VEQGVTGPLVQLCQKSEDSTVRPTTPDPNVSAPSQHTLTALPKVLGNAAGALATLALSDVSRAQLVAEGAVAPLVLLCGKVTDTRLTAL
jgi:hypothetical protein